MSGHRNALRCLAALLLGLGAAACSKRANDNAADEEGMGADSAAVGAGMEEPAPVTLTIVEKPGVGVFVSDPAGHAVYFLEGPDGTPIVSCIGECATAFDPVTGKAVVATGDTTVQVALISSIPLASGGNQVTYNGQPLYYYKGDQAANDTKGQGMTTGTTKSYLVSPSGSKIEK